MNITEQTIELMNIRDAILAALKERDSGRWRWDKIDCCMTGKDGDLTDTGQQGIEFRHIHDGKVYFYVHCGITYAADDVSLNLPDGVDSETWNKALNAYLEQAQHVIRSGPGVGEWDGDGWYFSDRLECNAGLVYHDGVFHLDATMQSIFECFDTSVEGWDREAAGVSLQLNQLAGWRNMDGTLCEPYKPTAAAWMPNPEESDGE